MFFRCTFVQDFPITAHPAEVGLLNGGYVTLTAVELRSAGWHRSRTLIVDTRTTEACNLMAVGNPRLDKIRFQLVISNRDTDLFAGSWMDSRPAGPAIAVALVRDISSPRTRRSRPKIRKKCLVLSPNRGNRGAVRREPPAQACQTARAVALAELRASSNSQPPHLEKLDPEKFGLQAVFAKIISSPPTAPTVMILAQVSSHSYKQ